MMKIKTLYLQMIFKNVVGNQSFFLLQPKLLTIWNPTCLSFKNSVIITKIQLDSSYFLRISE